MSEEQPHDASAKREKRLAKMFRWQALFQRCAEPLFVLNRQRRLLFVNRAWEALTGMTKEQARVLVCRRPQPPTPEDSRDDVLAHVLTPPREVLHGTTVYTRRRCPERDGVDRWWEIEFFPMPQLGPQGGYLILGHIRPIPSVEPTIEPRPFENLVPLRCRRLERFSLDAWRSSLPSMRRLVEQVRLASQTPSPVLLVGEAGTGKETLARTIHYLGLGREGSFATLDCRHLPLAAISSFLFRERNLIRDGVAAVYLREPASLPRDVQLLLCERLRRGGEASGPRVFAGCTIPPNQAVRSGQMLEELACALGVLVLEVPPLRERLADLPALVERLLPRACVGNDARITRLSADAWSVLHSYSWPGNLRELYNVLRSGCAHAQGEQLHTVDLPSELRRAAARDPSPSPVDKALPLEQLLEEAERRLIQLALQRAHGKKAVAARLLSIPRPRLWRRMIRLGIVDIECESDEPTADVPDPGAEK